jgi:hypothetical protein
MKVFLSWSGKRSKAVASALRDWLKLFFGPGVDPWMSQHDIAAGERWSVEVAKVLETCDFGIVCLTKENINAPWLLFEAGALSKKMAEGAVVPYLIDVEFGDVLKSPLGLFQGKKADREQTLQMVQAINDKREGRDDDARLLSLFESLWQRLGEQLASVQKEAPPQGATAVAKRQSDDVLEELIKRVQTLSVTSASAFEMAGLSSEVATMAKKLDAAIGLLQKGAHPSDRTQRSYGETNSIIEQQPQRLVTFLAATRFGRLEAGRRMILVLPEHGCSLIRLIADATGVNDDVYLLDWWMTDPQQEAVVDLRSGDDLVHYFGARDRLLELHAKL